MPQFDTLSFFSQITWVFFTFSLTYLAVSFFVTPTLSTILKLRNIWSNENISAESESFTSVSSDEKSAVTPSLSIASKPASLDSTSILNESTVGFVVSIFKEKSSLKPFFSNIAFTGFSRCHPF